MEKQKARRDRMLEFKSIQKNFGRKKVLRDISFSAEKNEVTCLIGINGIGKTTLLNAVMRLSPQDKGEIYVDGELLNYKNLHRISYISDQISMLKDYTVVQAMKLMETFHPNWNQERANNLIEFFEIQATEPISALSKGNVAKVNLLLGLALDTEYVLMDEPFSGIDIFTKEKILSLFSSSLMEGRGIILTTHNVEDIEQLVDKVVLIDDGNITLEFYAEEMREIEGKSVIDVMREVYGK